MVFALFNSLYADGTGWRRLIAQPTFDVAMNPLNHNTIFAGGEGRVLYRSYDGGVNWDTLVVGFKFGSVIFNNVILNPVDTNILLVGGLKFGMLIRSTDQGNNWEYVINSPSSLELNGKSLMFKPGEWDTCYLGEFRYGKIFRSIDKGKTWDSLSQVMVWRKYNNLDGTIIDTLVSVPIGCTGIREDSTNILLVGSTTGEMFISQDGGLVWNRTAVLTRPDSAWNDCEITRVTFSDRDPRVGFAVITYLFPKNTNNGGCFKTTDGGYNWERVAFKDTSMWAVAVRGFGNTDEVFVGGYTEDFYAHDTSKVPGVGIVRRSQDGGKTWWSYDQHIDWALKDPKSNAQMNSVYFRPKSDTGFACGLYSAMFKTTDRGENWSDVLYPLKHYLRGVQFVDHKIGISVADNGKIGRSVNGGWDWSEINSGINNDLMSVFFIDKKKGFAVGSNGVIISTADTGKTWQKVNSGVTDWLKKIIFINNQIGFICGNNGTFLKTTDGGSNWNKINLNTNLHIQSFDIVNEQTIYLTGYSGLILKTVDGGSNWSKLNSGTEQNLNAISIIDKANGIIIVTGDLGTILKSTDAGLSWTTKTSNTIRHLYSMGFSDGLNGTTAGQWGTMLRTTDGGENWWITKWNGGPWANMWSMRFLGTKGQEKLYMASEAGLFVLDNPSFVEQFNDYENNELKVFALPDNSVFFEYRNSSNSLKTVSIYSLLGRELLKNEFAGDNDIISSVIPTNGLTKGVYFLRISDDRNSVVKKFILE